MDLFSIILIILGLSLFEIITSIDNAIINAEVLSTMGQKARKWFLTWGIFSSVFLMRGLLPLFIVWATVPNIGPIGALTASFSSDPEIAQLIERSSGSLLMAGGVFLVFLFFNWLFLEPKSYGLRGERFFHAQGAWFYAVISILLSVIVWLALGKHPITAFGAVLGSTAFFITHGFRQFAEAEEKKILENKAGLSDLSKLLYLEVIDASFSIDGVIGAFAFTFAIPLIFLGNGIGAIVLRSLTISNIDRVKKYKYLKNGAMYSILILGSIMIMDGFEVHIPSFLSPVATIFIVSYFFLKSRIELNSSNHQSLVTNH